MTTPVARALEVLELLQSAGVRTASDLAARFDVDERTIRRTIDRLRELDIPIEAVQGRNGGFRVGAGWRMPPLMLTEDEAVAVLTSLMTTRSSAAAPTRATAAATAIAKIRRCLPRRLAERADAFLSTVVLDVAGAAPVPDPETLLTAAEAVRTRRPLAVTYRSADDTVTRRSVQPHDVVAYRGRWYLVGLDALSGTRRTFRLDRVRGLRVLPGTFPAAAEHQPVEELVEGFARADYRYRVELRVRATAEHVSRRLPASVAVIEPIAVSVEDAEPWQRVTIRAQRLDWLPPALLALDCPVVIEEPDELRDAVRDAAARLTAIAAH